MEDHSTEALQQLRSIEKRVDDGYQVLQCVKKMLAERASMEVAQSKGLQRHAKKWKNIICKRGGCSKMDKAAMVLVMEASKRAAVHARVAHDVESDSVKNLEELICGFYATEDEYVSEINPSNRRLLFSNFQKPWVKQASVLEGSIRSLYSLKNDSEEHETKLKYLAALSNFQEQDNERQQKILHLASECAKVEERGKARSEEILTSALDHLDFANSKSVEGTYDHLKWLLKIPYAKTDIIDELSEFAETNLSSESMLLPSFDNIDSSTSQATTLSDVHRVSDDEPFEDWLLNIEAGCLDETCHKESEDKDDCHNNSEDANTKSGDVENSQS